MRTFLRLLQRRVLGGGGAVVASDTDDSGLVGEKALVAVIARNGGEGEGVGIAVGVELSRRVMNEVAAGHGGLGGVARGLAEGLEGIRVGGGSVFVDGELALKGLDGFDSGVFGGGARILETKREREPNNGPNSGDDNHKGEN